MLDASLADITHTPPLVSGPLFAVLFYWVMTALGYRLLRLLGVPLSALNVWERGILSAAIGLGSLQVLPLALSSIGRLRPIDIRIAFVLLMLALARDMTRVARRFAAEVWPLRTHLRHVSAIQLAWLSLFFLFMGIWLIHAVTFGSLGDDDGIHLAGPKRWLAAGTLSYLPSYSLTNATLGFDMVYVVGIAIWSPIGAKILHYGAGILALLTLVLCARRISSALAAILAISLLLVATRVADLPVLFGNAMIDLAACWMTLTTVLVWLIWRERPHPRLLVSMALCAGFAASFKLTSVQVVIAWIPILVAEARRQGATWPAVFRLVAMFGIVAGAVVIPWFLRNALLTGNPLYPMLTSWIPTRDWSPEHGEIFSRYTRYYAWGVASGSRLSEVERKGLLLLAASLVSAGGAVVGFLVRSWILRALIAFATVFTLISISLTGLIFRYWMPATMCLALVLGVVCVERWSRRILWPATALLLVALVVQAQRGFYFHTSLAGDWRMAIGASTFDHEYANDPLVNTWKFLNSSTPREARILFAAFYTTFGASSYLGFWVDRTCYTTDSHLQTYFRLDNWESFKESIARAQITHVVISDEQFSANRHGFTFQAGVNEYPFLRRLVKEHGESVYRAGFFEVYRLQPETLSASLR